MAQEAGATPAEIAIAWVAAKGSLPIIGPRTLAQLENNLGAVKVALSAGQVARLDEASAIAPIFPHALLADSETRENITGGKAALFDAPAEPVA